MVSAKNHSIFILGLALFSMFFGSGNLIFPLFVGQVSQDSWLQAAFGFGLTGVILPFLGVIAMVFYHGNYKRFFAFFGERPGFLFTLILLTVWIPLGSAPRCIILAYSSLASQVAMPPLWLFSLFYSMIVLWVIQNKSRVIDVLGYVLTPILLTCIAIILVKGRSFNPVYVEETKMLSEGFFFLGLQEGYNTMDLIAAFFFSSSIIKILKQTGEEILHPLLKTLKASIVGIAILGIVYFGLINIAGIHSEALEGVSKDQLLATLAAHIMGSQLALVAIVAIVLACMTTSIALVVVYTDFLVEECLPKTSKSKVAMAITLISTFVMSIFGLEGVTAVTAPILSIIYPLLLALILINITRFVISHCFVKHSSLHLKKNSLTSYSSE